MTLNIIIVMVFSIIFSHCRFIFFHSRWQARKEQDRNMRAGLIPSRALQERRIVHERNEKLNTLVEGEGE